MAKIYTIINGEELNIIQNFLKKGHRKIANLLECSTISREYKKSGTQENYNYRKIDRITVDNYKWNTIIRFFLRDLKN